MSQLDGNVESRTCGGQSKSSDDIESRTCGGRRQAAGGHMSQPASWKCHVQLESKSLTEAEDHLT
eukprot:67287-Pelagomonas_calceolata.AAC.2